MQGDRCTRAAPILAWAVGRSRAALRWAIALLKPGNVTFV
jgi:hypothetical protein